MTPTQAAALFTLALLSSTAASAHIVMSNMDAPAGYETTLQLLVPHGCGASPVTEVHVKKPDSVRAIVPEQRAGWEATTVMRKLDKPMKMPNGREVTEVIDEIVWKGKLPPNQIALFNFFANLPDTPGARLFFKTVTKCEQGEERWVDTVADSEEVWRMWLLEKPSPFVVLQKPARPQLGVEFEVLQKARQEMKAKAGK